MQSAIKNYMKYVKNGEGIYMLLAKLGLKNNDSDEKYIRHLFKASIGKDLDLENPTTYNEKIQWLKLYDRKPNYTAMVDKYEAKRYVASIIGEQYIVPTYGVWNHFDDIDFKRLPNQFVLKCTHDSGSIVIVRNKDEINYKKARSILENGLTHNYYLNSREWPYKNVKPRIIAEQYIEDFESMGLPDYKFFTFNGVTKALFIATDRFKKDQETKFDFFDADFNHLPFTNGHPNASVLPKKPKHFEEMKMLAEALSKNIPHLRVDFYEVGGKIYFGELTFYHWSGLVPFDPPEWDYNFGRWITLPHKRIREE